MGGLRVRMRLVELRNNMSREDGRALSDAEVRQWSAAAG
jgi:hypothetical protein